MIDYMRNYYIKCNHLRLTSGLKWNTFKSDESGKPREAVQHQLNQAQDLR